MYDAVARIPREQFVALWNAAGSVAEAAERAKALVGATVPRWAVMARAAALRREGVGLKAMGAGKE